MTKAVISSIIDALNSNDTASAIEMLRAELNSMHEASAKKNAMRNAKAKEKRSAEMEVVLPVLRSALSDGVQRSAKDIAEMVCEEIGKTPAQVQYILLHDMADELVKVEAKGKPNLYGLKA